MAGGRPTLYTDELVEKAEDYSVNFDSYGDPVPTIAGLACELDVRRETIYAWSKDENKPEFSNIYNRIMEFQERRLVSGGLVGGFNPAVTKMMLTKHGYSDKVEQDHKSSDGTMSPTRIELVAPDDHCED